MFWKQILNLFSKMYNLECVIYYILRPEKKIIADVQKVPER